MFVDTFQIYPSIHQKLCIPDFGFDGNESLDSAPSLRKNVSMNPQSKLAPTLELHLRRHGDQIREGPLARPFCNSQSRYSYSSSGGSNHKSKCNSISSDASAAICFG